MLRENITLRISKKKIALCLAIIGSVSLLLKLYTIDFSLPPLSADSYWFVLRAIANTQGNFAESPDKTAGWPLFIAPFFFLINSNHYLDYANITRLLTLGISTTSIIPIYLLGRKFFDEKYSMVLVTLFAFEPHTNLIAGAGRSEPLFNLIFIVMFFFILNNSKSKYAFLAFLQAGLLWWVRINGIVAALSLTIVYFIHHRNSKNLLRNYVICIVIFLIVVSPILIQRNIQYGNPLYYTAIFGGTEAFYDLFPDDVKTEELILTGLKNNFISVYKMSIPYLIFLFPVGMLFSFWSTGQNRKNYIVNWVLLISTLAPLTIIFLEYTRPRVIYFLLPILIIFSTLAIKIITENRLNPFSLTKKRQNIFLILVIAFVIISSGLFTHGIGKYGYGKPDVIQINERIDYGKFLLHNLDGKMYWLGIPSSKFVFTTMLDESNGDFKKFRISPESDFAYAMSEFDSFNPSNFTIIKSPGAKFAESVGPYDSLEEIISNGEQLGLRYISVSDTNTYDFVNEVYLNEEEYPYLDKIFDWKEEGFQRFKVKAFEIDYEKFHQISG